MAGLTKSKGNMYDWVDYTHSHLEGRCQHECGYCYVQSMAKRFPNMKAKYSGGIRLDPESLLTRYPDNKTIFIDHLNDLFAENVVGEMIGAVLNHTRKYLDSCYVFQSKNPRRIHDFLRQLPDNAIIGTTVESNRVYDIQGNAPSPFDRITGIAPLRHYEDIKTFITIEPILDFDLDMFADMLIWASPDFINIGADSKGHGLIEPSYDKIMALYERITDAGIEVRKKINLDRLAKKE